ncbi:MAG: Gfo/Idh/MocA family oxidoreductase [Phycisphaeraceae bacterium]|nr:Gfo/Idh/MocA family oxidoreductase [Phycisphaeraceae bacterium]
MSEPLNVSRREFLSTTAAAGAGALTGTLAVPRGVQAAAWAGGSDSIRVGIVGCGGRGTGAAVQALRADAATQLVAMGDVFQERVDSSLKAIGDELEDDAARKVQASADRRFVGFDSYKRVIDSEIDVVLLTGYPAFRPAHLRYAVEAKKHVFLEKPVAVDGPGIRSVIESARLAKANNTGCLTGFCWRFAPGMREAFAHIHGGGIGDVVSVHTTYHTGTLTRRPRRPEWSDLEFQFRNWWHFAWLGGDHIVEQAVHSVDRLAWAMNDKVPARVTCLGGRAARSGPEHGDVFDHFAAVYEYDDGRRCFHTCRQIDSCPSDNSDYVYGSRGWTLVNGWGPTYISKDSRGETIWKFTGGQNDAGRMYQNEHDELMASIRAGEPINDTERGAHSTLMAIMARMAAYTGQTVSWEQAMNSTQSLVPEPMTWDTPAPPVEVPVPGRTRFF